MARLPPPELIDVPAYSGREQELELAVRATLEPEVRPFRGGIFAAGEYAGCQSSLSIASPGAERIGRLFQGRASSNPGSVAVLLRFGRTDAFLSTDRACLAPARRLPVYDRYEVLLEPVDGPLPLNLRVVERKLLLRLVPWEVSLLAMEALQESALFQEVMHTFGQVPAGSRLVDRPHAPPPASGILRRLLGTRPPVPLPPPPRQLKFYLDSWLPAGEHRFGDLFLDTRELKDRVVSLPTDGLAFSVEFIEGTTARHVHWRFRGTLLRAVMCGTEVVLAQRFVI